jgi:hypothetical protein
MLDGDNRNFLLLFIIGFSIRSIPNLLTPYPIGYDTIDYANTMLNVRFDFRNLLNFQTPLFILIPSVLSTLSSSHPFIILRFLQPILYGLLITSYYYATRRIYHWNKKWVIFSALIFCFQTTSLRLSWDLLRNELGLTILLFTLPKIANPRKSYSLILLPILVVLSHELTSVLLFVIVLGLAVRDIFYANLPSAKILILSILPSMIIFISFFFFGSLIPNVTANLVNDYSLPVNQTTTFPFVDYLSGEWTVDYEGSYLYLVFDVFSVFLASFLPLLPFLIKKLSSFTPVRNVNSIDLWAGFCAIAFLNCLVSPTFALLAWHRWMFLLIIPYSLYAVEGIMTIREKKMFNISFKTIIAVITCSIYLGLAILYLSSSYTNPLSLSAFINPASKYLPTTMLRHTTPIEDTLSITHTFQWINQHFTNQTCILVSDAFIDWARLNVNTEIPIINYRNKKVNDGLSFAQSLGYSEIYWLWWDNGVGLDWYGQSIPEVFTPVFQLDDMAVYKYSSSN